MTTTDMIAAGADLVTTTETAWNAPAQLTFQGWEQEGAALVRIGRAWQWWVGDWIIFGDQHFGNRAEDAMRIVGLEYRQISQIIQTAEAFPANRRRPALSWSHHEALADLNPPQADAWLDRAEQDGLTVARLRSRLKAEQAGAREAAEPAMGDVYEATLTVRYTAVSDAEADARLDTVSALLTGKGITVNQPFAPERVD